MTSATHKLVSERQALIKAMIDSGALATDGDPAKIQTLMLLSMDDAALLDRFKKLKRTRKRFTHYGINGRVVMFRRADDLAAVRLEVAGRGLTQ